MAFLPRNIDRRGITVKKLANGIVAIALLSLFPAAANAQVSAWVGERYQVDVTLANSVAYGYGHMHGWRFGFPTGTSEFFGVDPGVTNAQHDVWVNQTALLAEFVPVDHLGIDAGATYFAGQYLGNLETGHGAWDDGKVHSRFGDFWLQGRYEFRLGKVSITPSARVQIPFHARNNSHSDNLMWGGGYDWTPNEGHLAPSPGLTEFGGAIQAGALLANNRVFTQAGYGYTTTTVMQAGNTFPGAMPDLKVRLDRSDVFGLIGYIFTPKLDVGFSANYRHSHGGLEPSHPNWVLAHDFVDRIQLLSASIRAGYSFTDRISAGLSLYKTLWTEDDSETVFDMIAVGTSLSYTR
jgi:hypothetical protein